MAHATPPATTVHKTAFFQGLPRIGTSINFSNIFFNVLNYLKFLELLPMKEGVKEGKSLTQETESKKKKGVFNVL